LGFDRKLKPMNHKPLKVVYKYLPSTIFKSIDEYTSDSTVALLGYDDSDQLVQGVFGSGSLVKINSIYGVLTAKHVWNSFQKNIKIKKVSFCVLGYEHHIHERLENLRVYLPDEDVDICFIGLPPSILGIIKANSTFYPINKYNLPDIESIKDFLWVSVGFPIEIQPKQQRRMHILRYYTHLKEYNSISKKWDIIELDVEGIEPSKLPKSFGGMSGGGIWNFNVFYNDDSGEKIFFTKNSVNESILAGVNFFETVVGGRITRICGVGPVSIYLGMTDLVR